MKKRKYSALNLAVGLMRLTGVFVALGGIAFSLLAIWSSVSMSDLGLPIDLSFFGLTRGLLSIAGSIIAGVLIWAFADFVKCLMDLEYNTRQPSEL